MKKLKSQLKSKKKKLRVMVTSRDKAIFRFLFEQKVASQESIHNRFFSGKSNEACIKRMQMLFKCDFVKKINVPIIDRYRVIYSLTEKSFRLIKDGLSLNGNETRLKSDSIEHDLELTKLRLVIEDFSKIVRVYPENYLQCCNLGEHEDALLPLKEINADAALLYRGKKGSFFLSFEYERTLKQRSRYKEKLLDYYLDKEITAVLYLCKTRQIERVIRQVDNEYRKERASKVYTLCHEEIQLPITCLPFTNLENATLVLE